MNRPIPFTYVVLLLVLIGSAAWAVADSKSVNFLFEAEWMVDPKLPGGGIIVSRGEGTNGVITVDLPLPPPEVSVDTPIKLTADNVTYMDIKVVDENGVTRHYTSEHIKTVNYRIDLEYEWDNGVTQKYLVENIVEAK
ncbi:MAG: hypothetical protein WC824_01560 [Bacteroidota bacterium]|jgi:hypothetical protein